MSAFIDELARTIDQQMNCYKVNQVISSWMEFYNAHKHRVVNHVDASRIVQLMRVFAPSFSPSFAPGVRPVIK